MIPRGAAALIAMRKSGQRPAGEIFVSYGDFIEPAWWKYSNTLHAPELLIRPADPIARLDFRCVVGLNLILFAADWSDSVADLFDRLTEYAAEIAVMSPAFDEDIGWRWIKDLGRIEYGETHYIEDLASAKASATDAARRDDKPAYQAAQAAEKRIREAAPWLK